MSTFSPIQKPESVVVGQNVNYTVPAGRVARVSITADVDMRTAMSDAAANALQSASSQFGSSNHDAKTVTLRAGDILSSTRTTGSTSVAGDNGGSRHRAVASSASVSVTINAVTAFSVVTSGGGAGTQSSGASGTLITLTGTANMGFVAEEYFE